MAAITTNHATNYWSSLCTVPLLCVQESLEQRDLSQASLSPLSSRKQRHGSDSEYTEKLQQYSEFDLLIPAFLSSLGPHSTLRCYLLLPINAIS